MTAPYRIDYWKPIEGKPGTKTCATKEDATEAEVTIGRIRYRPKKFKLPEEAYQLDEFERFLLEAHHVGRLAGKAEIRNAILYD